MGLIELCFIAVGLSMDAFAVSICKGLACREQNLRNNLLAGLYFGGFQGLMPAIGWLLGVRFSEAITSIDHWIAFVLLGFIGGKMAFETGSNSYLQALRRAAKQTLYMYLHVRVTNRDYAESIGDTAALRHDFKPAVLGWRHLVALIDLVAVALFALAIRGIVRDVKLYKAAKAARAENKNA